MDTILVPQPPQGTLAALPCHSQHEGMLAGITLITGRRSYTHLRMHAQIVKLALAAPVRVLIGGNHYDHYGINYALAAATCDYEYILDHHIHLSRAETCYQMVELLTHVQADGLPVLILDLLTTFSDEGVPEREIDQLLFEAILQLRRLSSNAGVAVSVHSGQNRSRLLEVLRRAVDRIEGPPVPSFQPMLQQLLIG